MNLDQAQILPLNTGALERDRHGENRRLQQLPAGIDRGERAGIQWKDLGLIEIHEAFASQVLSNLQGFAAKGWEINEDIINVMGGSIAIGHPFGATGGRLVTTLSNEMKRRDVQFGLISVCAQGGMGFAMVLERR